MKGLFLKNLYMAIENIKFFIFIVLAMGAALLIIGSSTAAQVFVYISMILFSVSSITSTKQDALAKWNKYEITMPISRKEIVNCKYLSYLCLMSVGIVITVIFMALAIFMYGKMDAYYGLRDFISMFAFSIGISMNMGSLFYPLVYMLDVEKSEILLIISTIGAIVLTIFMIGFVNLFVNVGYYMMLAIFVVIYIILFIISYLITRYIYQRKEF